jgi:hypothetical protein
MNSKLGRSLLTTALMLSGLLLSAQPASADATINGDVWKAGCTMTLAAGPSTNSCYYIAYSDAFPEPKPISSVSITNPCQAFVNNSYAQSISGVWVVWVQVRNVAAPTCASTWRTTFVT